MTDHDALITLVSEVKQVRIEIKDLKSDVAGVRDHVTDRVLALEKDKLSRVEFDKAIVELSKDQEKIHDEFKKQLETHDLRINSLATFRDTLMGKYSILGVIGGVLVSVATTLITLIASKILNVK